MPKKPTRRSKTTVFDKWGFTPEEVSDLIDDNPSFKGLVAGYLAEVQLRRMHFSSGRAEYLGKHDDHDREHSGDLILRYRGHEFDLESKSLNGKNFKFIGGVWYGKAQIDGSDSRPKVLPDGKTVSTVLLPYGTFDIVAVNLFEFEQQWRFVFAKNKDLLHCKHKKLTPEQQKYLIMSSQSVTWPPTPPWTDDPYKLMDEIIAEREAHPTPPNIIVDETETGETKLVVRGTQKGRRTAAPAAGLLPYDEADDIPSKS
jgi:hypothetical protein